MPYQITRLKNGKYQVENKDTWKIHAEWKTKQKQKKLQMNGVDG